MAYQVISQNNTTTTLADENGNIIRVPARVSLATSTDYTIKKVNNTTATLEDGNGNIIRDVPCVAVLYGGGGGGGGDQHNLGWYATESALTTAHPTASNGDWAIVGSTDTVWVWDSDNEEWVDSDQKGQVTSVNGQTGAVTVDTLPSQTGQSGKFLTTDGTDASWSDKPLVNTATGNYSMCIGQTGSSASGLNSLAVGSFANSAQRSVAIGAGAITNVNYTVAIGDQAGCYGGQGAVALGSVARANAANAIQIAATNNVSVNSDANTFKVANNNGNYEMMSADGTIPTARLTKVNSTITLAAADWSSNTQTVSVNGVTSTSVVFVAPDPADTTDYVSAGILCTSQGTNSLTFTATTTPSADIDVVVVAM